jgi:hypothetical protein
MISFSYSKQARNLRGQLPPDLLILGLEAGQQVQFLNAAPRAAGGGGNNDIAQLAARQIAIAREHAVHGFPRAAIAEMTSP